MINLSVIIPVYNVENTLRRCIDSVLMQGVEGMEIILVDDGSTDNSPSICDEYGGEGRATVVHQKNGGLSSARNTGIELAKGEYITFIDSDDYLYGNTYRQLLPLMAGGCDIVEFPVDRETPNGVVRLSFGQHEFNDMREYWIEGRAYAHTYAWNKIYRRELFRNVRYPEGEVFEDVPTLWRVLRYAHMVRTVETGCYRYTLNPAGITQQADGYDLAMLLRSHVSILSDNQLAAYKGFSLYYRHVLNIQLSCYDLAANAHELTFPVMPYWNSLKLVALHIFGLRNLCRIHRLYFLLSHVLRL